ncbi:MAG: nuclear transport factor 2 family protein [Verrucomicrobiia bacterium]|jgi:ketosteroid isomerase-like protein
MTTRAAGTVANEIENWLQRFAKAYSCKDLDAVMAMMDSGKPLLILGSGPDEKRFNASQLRKGICRDFSQVDKLSMSFDWIKTDAQGDVAWFASEASLAVTVCKQKVVHLFRFTGVLVKSNEQWLLRMGQMGLVAANQHAGESWPSKQ